MVVNAPPLRTISSLSAAIRQDFGFAERADVLYYARLYLEIAILRLHFGPPLHLSFEPRDTYREYQLASNFKVTPFIDRGGSKSSTSSFPAENSILKENVNNPL